MTRRAGRSLVRYSLPADPRRRPLAASQHQAGRLGRAAGVPGTLGPRTLRSQRPGGVARSPEGTQVGVEMSVAVGGFDVFAYSIPGALYLAILLYLLDRTPVLDVRPVLSSNTSLATIGALLASYLLGHLTYLPRRYLDQRIGRWARVTPGAREEFLQRVPAARGKRYVQADPFFLLAALEIEAAESAVDISRLRASGVALRNAAFALLLAALVAAGELAVGNHRVLAGLCLVGFPAAALSALRAGFTLSHWATLKTFETAFWLPDIEARFTEQD